MHSAEKTLEHFYLEMRWRTLSLAADLDRIDRAPGGDVLMRTDPRLLELRRAIEILLSDQPDRAARVQQLLSDPLVPLEQ